MKGTFLLILIACLIGCADNKEFPIKCNSNEVAHLDTENYEFVDHNIKIKVPEGWTAVDDSYSDFDGVLFGDKSQDDGASTFAIMVIDSIAIPLQEYSDLEYENTLNEDVFSKAQKGQITINGRPAYWHFVHNHSNGLSIGIVYYMKDEETDRIIMIPTSTTLVDDYEKELCKLKKLVETIEIK